LSEDGYRVRYQVVPAEEKQEQGKEETASEGTTEHAESRDEGAAQEESRDEEATNRETEDGWIYIASWPPAAGEKLHVLENLTPGDWTVILELVDENDKLVSANEWNHTERTITVK
jgi:hypothetical protein